MTRARHLRPAISLLNLFVAIFALSVPASAEWKEKVLYSFQGPPDGLYPIGALAFDKAGNLYGATSWGGEGPCAPTQCGTVFQLTPTNNNGGPWTENVLHIFKGRQHGDGNTPAGGVIFDAAGNLYGTTAYGGTGNCVVLGSKTGCGTVFEMKPPTTKTGNWTEGVLYSFKSGKDGYLPNGDLVFDNAGNLYGATEFGGGFGSCDAPYYQYCGTIFELSPPTTKAGKWTETVLYSFKSGTDGANPNGGLVFDSKGNIYGTTSWGGSTTGCADNGFVGCGTALRLDVPGKAGGAWAEKILHRFSGGFGDGQGPNGNLIFDSSGNVFGTTRAGGGAESGTIFQLGVVKGTKRWAETILYSFQGGVDGWAPDGGVVIDPSGNLYGTTTVATTKVQGTVFRLQPSKDNSWVFRTLYGFAGGSDSGNPTGSLVLRESGALFGTANHGGDGPCQGGCGTVFRVRR
jgi:hypothetical protein